MVRYRTLKTKFNQIHRTKMKKENNYLIAIQNELKAPKNQYNSFGKYKYRSAEDKLETIKPLLKKKKRK